MSRAIYCQKRNRSMTSFGTSQVLFWLSVKNQLLAIVPSSSVSNFSVNRNFSQWWYLHTPPPLPSLTHVASVGCLPTHYLWSLDTDNAYQRHYMYLPIACSVPNRELARLPWCYQKGSSGVLVKLANSCTLSRLYLFHGIVKYLPKIITLMLLSSW